jgi:hypothetical protein
VNAAVHIAGISMVKVGSEHLSKRRYDVAPGKSIS